MSSGVAVYEAVDGGDDFVFKDFNKAAEQAERVVRRELFGRRVTEVFPGVEKFGILDVFRRVWKSGTPEHHPVSLYQDDRIAGWRENYVCKLPSGEVVAVYDDVTQQKQAEEVLLKSEEGYRTLVETSPDIIFQEDPEGNLLFVNRVFTEVLGYSAEESTKLNRFDLSHPDDLESLRNDMRPLFEGRLVRNLECRIRSKTGSYLHFSFNISPVSDPEGKLVSILGIAEDVTDRKRAKQERRVLEAKFQQAQKLESLGVLAGGIAHDFNNLLVGILGNADLTLMDLPPESPVRESIADIVAAARRAAELIRQMLAYSGKGRFVVERLDLKALVEELAHLLDASISKKAILRYDFAHGVPAVEADATQLRQVVMNLITNASDAIAERSGMISIRTGAMDCDRAYLRDTYFDEALPEGVYSYIEISDTGVGMDAQTRAKIFDPFFSTKFTGRGLGLAAVLGIVRGHRGALKVDSEPGRGSTFRILLPAVDGTPATREEAARALSEWTGEGTVLLVDDEETVRTVSRHMLERLGFEVLTTGDGREALEIFAADPERFTLVLLDLTMPELDGEECFQELRRIREQVPVILSSGYDEQELTSRFVGQGLAGFIQKPYELDTLAEKLKQALG
ncbi:MAG: PAS domain S-box protein [bacterium]|nr:PAS domain S-box protein [bacterium]